MSGPTLPRRTLWLAAGLAFLVGVVCGTQLHRVRQVATPARADTHCYEVCYVITYIPWPPHD